MSVYDYGTDVEPPIRRRLGEEDVEAFMRAADLGAPTRTKAQPDNPADVLNTFVFNLSIKYKFRMRRLGRDLDWLRKQAHKAGLTEEDVKCLL